MHSESSAHCEPHRCSTSFTSEPFCADSSAFRCATSSFRTVVTSDVVRRQLQRLDEVEQLLVLHPSGTPSR